MKRAITLAWSLAFLLGGAACGGGQPTPTMATPAPPPATATPRPALPTAAPTVLPTFAPSPAPALRVGLDAANPPWCVSDARGALVGIDVDLLSMLGREMGVRFVAVNLPPHLLASELAAGRVDVIAAGLVSTTERAKIVALSRPYLTLEQAVVVRGADPAVGPPALAGRPVGVQIGSIAVGEARKAGGTVKVYDDLAIALAALARGEVAAVLGDQPSAVDYVRRHPELGLKMAGTAGAAQPVAMAVARENVALLSRVNGALAALERRGDLGGLERRWLR